MKIHGLCVVKNEADIIEQTLRSAARWCDSIYVLDNGSTDGTWEKVQALAGELPQVIPFAQDARPFDDGIRGVILRHHAARAKRDDWWCILDADEFYIDDPRDFLARIPGRYLSVWMQLYVYLFTDKDLVHYRQDPERFDALPIEERLRYYVNGDYSELRFFRHSDALEYVPGADLHPIYPLRIRMKHFAYRSPEQIHLRLETRREPMQRGEFLHEKKANWVMNGRIVPGPARPSDLPQSWEERIKLSSRCHFDRQDGYYAQEDFTWAPPKPPGWPTRLRSQARSLLRKLRSKSGSDPGYVPAYGKPGYRATNEIAT
jgi:glycosyltransferase involved in cell wall biosynthesis